MEPVFSVLQLLLKGSVDVSGLSDIIVSQDGVGSMIQVFSSKHTSFLSNHTLPGVCVHTIRLLPMSPHLVCAVVFWSIVPSVCVGG